MKLPRPPFAPLLLTVLAVVAASQIAVGTVVYRRLESQLEDDLGRRLVHAAELMATIVDVSVVRQLGAGDERLAAYGLLRARLGDAASAAGVERAYVFDATLRTLLDGGPSRPGGIRYALLAHRNEAASASAGVSAATRLYRDDHGSWRLSAFAPIRRRGSATGLVVGVDASPEFFGSLAALRRQMLALGGSSLALVALAGFVVVRQVGRRLARLRGAVGRATRGDLLARVEVGGADEIGALGRDLDRMIAAMVEARDEYAAVLGSLEVGLVTSDEGGEITLANASARRILAAPGDLVGRSLAEVLPDPDLLAFASGALARGEAASAELPLRGGLAGGGRVVAVSAGPLRGSDAPRGLVLSFLDVTELRALERRARSNEQLAALGGMAGGLLHEVRTPLASMIVYLDLLRAPLAGTAEPRELLEGALAEGERLARFLEDFQVFAGLRPLRIERVRVADVLDAALRSLTLPPNVGLGRSGDGEVRLEADRRLLDHALANLLRNAVEAMTPRGGRIETRVAAAPGTVTIVVADDGPGIAREALGRVLDPLFTTKPAGTGLGLSIVERVIERHRGALTVETSERGTVFTMKLPAGG